MTEPSLKAFDEEGCFIARQVLEPKFISEMKVALELAIQKETEFHKNENHKDHGMVLICPQHSRIFIDLLENKKFLEPVNTLLSPGSIVYAYTSSSMPPNGTNYSARVHVDCPRFIPNYMTNMGVIVMLDDFKEENGASWYLPGSHKSLNLPSEEHFWKNSSRVLGQAGDVFYFNARLWHAGGKNITEKWRHAVTINMCRPYMKQRIDLPRALQSVDLDGISDTALQKLGFLAQVPASLEEYYLPPEKRKFRQTPE